ncbi:unnamed protein product [Caenorhabditis brenneri]
MKTIKSKSVKRSSKPKKSRSTSMEPMDMPLPPREQMLGMLGIADLHAVSILSETNAIAVRMAQRKYPEVCIRINVRHGTRIRLFKYPIKENDNFEFEWCIPKKAPKKSAKSVWSLDGMDVMTSKLESRRYYTAIPRRGKRNETVNAIIAHILFIFPRCIVEELRVFLYDTVLRPEIALQAITRAESVKLEHVDLWGHSVKILQKIEISRSYTNESFVYVGGRPTVDNIHCTDVFQCEDASWVNPEKLLSLNCRQIRMNKTRFRKEHLMAFLRHWQSAPADQIGKIREVNISHPFGVGRLDFEKLNAQPYDPRTSRLFERHECKDLHQYSEFSYTIWRKDGIFATVEQYSETTMTFSVWHRKPTQDEDQN